MLTRCHFPPPSGPLPHGRDFFINATGAPVDQRLFAAQAEFPLLKKFVLPAVSSFPLRPTWFFNADVDWIYPPSLESSSHCCPSRRGCCTFFARQSVSRLFDSPPLPSRYRLSASRLVLQLLSISGFSCSLVLFQRSFFLSVIGRTGSFAPDSF